MRSNVQTFAAAVAIATGVVLGGAGLATPAYAQQAPSDRLDPQATPKRLEFTPFMAMGDDLAPGGGAAFTFEWTKQLSLEAEASLGTDARRSSLSLLYHIPQLGRFAPYVAGGAGIQRDEVDTMTELLGHGPGYKTEFAVNIGAGVTVPVGPRWAWRADFRWYNPKAEWPESWRVYNGLTLSLRH